MAVSYHSIEFETYCWPFFFSMLRRGQTDDEELPEEREGRPKHSVCYVAGHTLGTPDVAYQVNE